MDTAVLLLLFGMMCVCLVGGVLLLLALKKKKKSNGGTGTGNNGNGNANGNNGNGNGGGGNGTSGVAPPPGNKGGGDGKQIKNEDQMFAQVKANVNQLMGHLKKKYASDKWAKALIGNYRNVVKHKGQYSGLARPEGIIEILVSGRQVSSLPDVNNTITHELAHLSSMAQGDREDHGSFWRRIFLWLTNIATNDLGWTIGFGDLECDSYKICPNQKNLCRKCVWGYRRPLPGATWQQETPRMPSSLLA